MLVKVTVNASLTHAIKSCFEELEISFNDCSPGDKILLKPNFNTADPYPASSDFEFLNAVISFLIDFGCDNLILGDSSTMMLKTEEVMAKLNIYELEKRYGNKFQIVNFNENAWIPTEIPKGKYLKHVSLPETLVTADKLILLPCLKTHKMAKYTGALKLSVGFMEPKERLALHSSHLQEKISELNTVIKPCLILMDARKAFINGGPSSGELAEPNLILASKSRTEIDTEGVNIIRSYERNSLKDTPPEELTQIKYAKELGIE